MNQTTHEIKSHIEETRNDLGDNLDELEQKVKSVTDWRRHFQSKPMMMLGVAFGGGILLAATLTGSRRRRVREYAASGPGPYIKSPQVRHQALETWDNIKGALIGVAATRFTDFVDQVVPGFNKHYQTAGEKRKAAQPPRDSENAGAFRH